MKSINTFEIFGYLYLLLALANHFGPKAGGNLLSWGFVLVAIILLVVGTITRKRQIARQVEQKQSTWSTGTIRREKRKVK